MLATVHSVQEVTPARKDATNSIGAINSGYPAPSAGAGGGKVVITCCDFPFAISWELLIMKGQVNISRLNRLYRLTRVNGRVQQAAQR